MCPMPLVGELDLMWMQVMSFLMICWPLSPWYGMGLEIEKLELVLDIKLDFLSV